MAPLIDTAVFANQLRSRAINLPERKVLVSRLAGSDQIGDITDPPNCGGLGRVRHFKLKTATGWPTNPLPIVPACKALGLEVPEIMTAQVFQNAACAWRCWYCFVPVNLLTADVQRSEWRTAEDLVGLYRNETEPPLVIDLSGGSPDLVPEWTPWMMEALRHAGLSDKTYLWTDDNLSTEYLFDLPPEMLRTMAEYGNYGRVCCFKGFDDASFSFNTRAKPEGFAHQFDVMKRLLTLGLDTYGYLTLTALDDANIVAGVKQLVDRLQELDPNLPLRVIPLRIHVYKTVDPRLDDERNRSIEVQEQAIALWNGELATRFSEELRHRPITDVPMLNRRGRQ